MTFRTPVSLHPRHPGSVSSLSWGCQVGFRGLKLFHILKWYQSRETSTKVYCIRKCNYLPLVIKWEKRIAWSRTRIKSKNLVCLYFCSIMCTATLISIQSHEFLQENSKDFSREHWRLSSLKSLSWEYVWGCWSSITNSKSTYWAQGSRENEKKVTWRT